MPWEKQFDVEQARRNAMSAFWTHGYETTSMQDLLKAMGIQRGSFYDTFKSKRDVLLAALAEYDQGRRETFRKLAQGHSPKQAIEALFRGVVAEAKSESGRRGCFLVNSALELAPRDADVAKIVNRAFAETETFFRSMIERGQAEGEIPKHVDPVRTAQALLGMLLGMRVLARSGAGAGVLKAIAAQAAGSLR
jgi:TetR/AcrR family transcriptional repressor of nem operon